MAPYGVIVTARQTFRDQPEEMDFVFHYDTGVTPTVEGWIELLVAVRDALKPLYRTDVAFIRGRVHGPTNAGEAADQMRAAVDWPTGQSGSSTSMDFLAPESAVILEWDLGRSAQGYRQILKKFLRGCVIPGASTEKKQGRNALSTADKAPFITAGNSLKAITIGGVINNICNPAGKNFPAANQPNVVNYTHTRQLRRGRKRAQP